MTGHAHLLLPLSSGFIFALGAIFSKRAMTAGIGPWRMTVVNAWVSALAFLPLLLIKPGTGAAISFPLYQPVLLGAMSLAGNLLLFLALSRGDASVATPLVGVKVVIVALLTVVVLGDTIPLTWWAGAVVSVLGMLLLRPLASSGRQALGWTVVWSLASATTFATGDLLVQGWVTPANFPRFIPMMFGAHAVLAGALIPLFREGLLGLDARTWKALLAGALCMALQGLLFIFALSKYGHATAMNIAYTTRGLWSVVLVWLGGRALAGEESEIEGRVMASRLIGASLLLVAVVLVLL